jgi:hypothetical protein
MESVLIVNFAERLSFNFPRKNLYFILFTLILLFDQIQLRQPVYVFDKNFISLQQVYISLKV